jgi:hypothetical protein
VFGELERRRSLEHTMMAEAAVRPSDLKTVLEPVDREKAAVANGNPGEYLGILAEDAQFLPPNSPAKCGAELRNWLEAFVREFRGEWLRLHTTGGAGARGRGLHARTHHSD